jgi:hypothetical protein
MRTAFNRRTATKIKDGRVQRKNGHLPTGCLGYVLDRESPGKGFRHVVSKRDLQAFIEVIPDSHRLCQRLERIVLARCSSENDGAYEFYHREETGAIFLNAWPENLWIELETDYFEAHEPIFYRLGVSFDRAEQAVFCRFTEAQARAFTLLHVFLHELGHHHDHLHQKHRNSRRGEDYAERFATSRFEQLYLAYLRIFGDPKRGGH